MANLFFFGRVFPFEFMLVWKLMKVIQEKVIKRRERKYNK
jgi:hypothetical protein